jgi:hypothetical protein
MNRNTARHEFGRRARERLLARPARARRDAGEQDGGPASLGAVLEEIGLTVAVLLALAVATNTAFVAAGP